MHTLRVHVRTLWLPQVPLRLMAAAVAVVAAAVAVATAPPPDVRALLRYANDQEDLGRPQDALAAYQSAVDASPRHGDALLELARAVLDFEGDAARAEALYLRADDAFHGRSATVKSALAALAADAGQWDAAVARMKDAVALRPGDASVQASLQGLLARRSREEAGGSKPRVAAAAPCSAPDLATALALPAAFVSRDHLTTALQGFTAAVSHVLHASTTCVSPHPTTNTLDPAPARVGHTHGFMLSYVGAPDRRLRKDVAAAYAKAWPPLVPRNPPPLPAAARRAGAVAGRRLPAPLLLLPYGEPPARGVRVAAAPVVLGAWANTPGVAPLRVGFLTASFSPRHSLGKLLRRVVAQLGRRATVVGHVQVFVVSGPDDSVQLEAQADVAPDGAAPAAVRPLVTLLSPTATLASLRRRLWEEDLDVLVFMDVSMDATTYFLSFARLAALQVLVLNNGVTSGVTPTMDVVLSPARHHAPSDAGQYTELLVTTDVEVSAFADPAPGAELPDGVAAWASRRRALRTAVGVPASASVLLVPHLAHKLHPDMDAVLTGVLRDVPDAVLVFIATSPRVADVVHRRLRLPDDRVVVLPPLADHRDFLRLMHAADVMLDSFPFGSGVTAWEAVAVGLPFVTLPGAFRSARIAAALLQAMDTLRRHPDDVSLVDTLVAADTRDYVARVRQYAALPLPQQLAVRQAMLQRKHVTFPPPADVATQWEAALAAMWLSGDQVAAASV